MSDRITDDKLDHLIRIQDMQRCQMAHAMAADDGFHEGNVHAGMYRALVELKDLRAENAAERERYEQLQARCFDQGSQSVFDAVRELRAEVAALRDAAGKVTCNECGMYMQTPSGKWSPCPDCAALRALLEQKP